MIPKIIKAMLLCMLHYYAFAQNTIYPYHTLGGHASEVNTVLFSPNNQYIISGSKDGTIIVWDARSGSRIKTLAKYHTNSITKLLISKKHKKLYSCGADGRIISWNVDSFTPQKAITAHFRNINSLSISPDEKYIISVSIRSIKIWNINNLSLVKELKSDSPTYVAGFTASDKVVSFENEKLKIKTGKNKQKISVISLMKIWDFGSGRLIKKVRLHVDATSQQFAISQDGKYAVSAAYVKKERQKTNAQFKQKAVEIPELKLWNLSNASLIKKFRKPSGIVKSLIFSKDSKYITACVDDKSGQGNIITTWQMSSSQKIYDLPGFQSTASALQFSSNNNYLVSGHSNRSIRLWDLATKSLVWSNGQGHYSSINTIKFSRNGKYIISGSRDKTIILWDASKLQPIKTFNKHSASVNDICFLDDDKRFLSASSDRYIVLWDLNKTKPIKSFFGHRGSISSIIFDNSKNLFYSGSQDNSLGFWKTNLDKFIKKRDETHIFGINKILLTPNQSQILTAGGDNKVKLWDKKRIKLLKTFHGHKASVQSIDIHPNGQIFISSSLDKTIIIWNLKTGQQLRTLKGHLKSVNVVKFSPDGSLIASGSSDNTLKIWETSSGQLLKNFNGYPSAVKSIEFSPNGKFIFTGNKDNVLNVWDRNALASDNKINLFDQNTNNLGSGRILKSPNVFGSKENNSTLFSTTSSWRKEYK